MGSPAILLKNILEEFGEKVVIWDPYVDGNETQFKTKYNLNNKPSLYFIGTKHNYFKKYKFTKNSIIIDPFRYLNLKKNVKYIPLGKSIL